MLTEKSKRKMSYFKFKVLTQFCAFNRKVCFRVNLLFPQNFAQKQMAAKTTWNEWRKNRSFKSCNKKWFLVSDIFICWCQLLRKFRQKSKTVTNDNSLLFLQCGNTSFNFREKQIANTKCKISSLEKFLFFATVLF